MRDTGFDLSIGPFHVTKGITSDIFVVSCYSNHDFHLSIPIELARTSNRNGGLLQGMYNPHFTNHDAKRTKEKIASFSRVEFESTIKRIQTIFMECFVTVFREFKIVTLEELAASGHHLIYLSPESIEKLAEPSAMVLSQPKIKATLCEDEIAAWMENVEEELELISPLDAHLFDLHEFKSPIYMVREEGDNVSACSYILGYYPEGSLCACAANSGGGWYLSPPNYHEIMERVVARVLWFGLGEKFLRKMAEVFGNLSGEKDNSADHWRKLAAQPLINP